MGSTGMLHTTVTSKGTRCHLKWGFFRKCCKIGYLYRVYSFYGRAFCHGRRPFEFLNTNLNCCIIFCWSINCFHLQTSKDVKLQEGAMFAIKNLIDKNDLNTTHRLNRLREMGLVDKLEVYLSMCRESRSSEEYEASLRNLRFLC